MKTFIILIIVSLAGSDRVYASEISSLIRAPSLSNLKLRLKESRHLENIRSQCEIQLKLGMLPNRCFEVIRIEKRNSMITQERFDETQAWLLENCNERANQLKELRLNKSQVSFLPKACREIAEQKIENQHYRDVTMDPAALFKRRL